MQDLTNVKELTIDVLTEKVVEMVQELQRRVNGESAATSTESAEEIIEHEGLKLKRVDRVAREGDYFKVVGYTDGCFIGGEIYGPVNNKVMAPDHYGDYFDVYEKTFNRIPSIVEVFEVIDVQAEKLSFPEVELTANQKRAKLIEQAKKYVEEQKQVGPLDCYTFNGKLVEVGFHRKNNCVTCVVNDLKDGYTVNVGRADCMEGDVFNLYIGQAIALAKALDIVEKLPQEFLKAVQPLEIETGMIVIYTDERIVEVVKDEDGVTIDTDTQTYLSTAKEFKGDLRITDDTNAKYEVD